jgi:dipeptidyl aminopeptidase/acylaminoacyl peptidase
MAPDPCFDSARTAVIGHSAGGHLALWLSGLHRIKEGSPLYERQKQTFTGAVSLAGVPDLRLAWKQKLGHGIVTRLMGGTPDERPDRYDAGSPIDLLPTGSKHFLVHGTADDTVPLSQSEAFVKRAARLGDRATLVKLEGTGHFELIDPESEAWPSTARAVLSLLGMGRD